MTTSKLIYLIMDYETFNQLPVLEQARGLLTTLQTCTMKL